jgi:integrase
MTIDQSNEASADPIFTIKSRVIDMKQLEALKKKLPKGIDIRISSSNVVTFRARFRKRGHPEITQTFPDLKLAKNWLIEQNRNAMMGIHLPHLKASKRTLAEAVDRYLELEKEEIKKLLECTRQSKSKDLYAVVVIALGTGMRLSEIMNLQWQEVDIVNEVIKLPTSKNGDPRFIPMKGLVLDVVKARAEKQGIKRGDLLFPSSLNPKQPIDIRSA